MVALYFFSVFFVIYSFIDFLLILQICQGIWQSLLCRDFRYHCCHEDVTIRTHISIVTKSFVAELKHGTDAFLKNERDFCKKTFLT